MIVEQGWVVLAATAAEVVVALLLLYLWRTRARHPGLGSVAFGLGVVAAGAVYYVLFRIDQPVWFGPFVYHGVIAVSTTALLNGLVLMVGQPAIWRRLAGIFAGGLMAISILFLMAGQAYFPLGQATTALTMGMAFLAAGPALYRAQGDLGRRTPQVLAVVMSADGVLQVLRAVAIAPQAWFPGAPSFAEILAVNSVVQLVFILILLALVVQIVGDRLFAQLHASRAALASAFQVASDGFALFDGDGRLVSANDRVAALFPDLAGRLRPGAAFAALFGAGPAQYGFTPDYLARFAEPFDALSEPRPDFWLRVVVSPSPSGGALACWTDVSDFKRVERLLQQELGRERDLARLRTGFVSMASHEFRTPLAIIDVAAQRLSPRHWPPPREQAAESVRRIRDAVVRVLKLIDTMLAPAVTRSEGMKLSSAPCDLRGLIADLCARHQVAIDPKVIVQDLDGLPPAVDCDAELIGHALDHLLGNADKYSPGARTIQVRGGVEGDHAVIAVSDAGIGIPAVDRGLVFERFFRAPNALAFQGTGMGLGIVREIVKLHGGSVAIDSEVGRGTTVTLHLPVRGLDEGN